MATSSLPPFPQPHVAAAVVGIIFALLRLCNSSNVDKEDGFRECSPQFDCGLIHNLTYPFWGGDRPSFCGSQVYKLECRENDYPVMKISDREFSVLHVNQSPGEPSITIRWLDWNRSWCLPRTTNFPQLYFPSFTRTSTVSMTVLYNCSSRNPPNPSLVRNFTCHQNGREERQGLFMLMAAAGRREEWGCEEEEVIQVKREAVEGDRGGDLKEILRQGFDVNYLAWDSYCEQCGRSGGRCGSNNSSSAELFKCHCLNGPGQFRCEGFGIGHQKLVLSIVAGIVVATLLTSLSVLLWFRRKKVKQSSLEIEALIKRQGTLAPKRYNYSEIKKITNSLKEKLGHGGFGAVYKGKLPTGHLVAVKVLKTSEGNGQDFINEVTSISKTSHVNVVTLLGYCLEAKKRALIYEFMPNGSLDKFIYSEKCSSLDGHFELGWESLFRIAIGIARGLEYLHNGCNTRIVHFDIKPHNILLDDNLCPKISDFGLAKLCTRNDSIISLLDVRGTIGYIAPEVFNRNFGNISHKSDVYSYGMMVLEIARKRKNIDIGYNQTTEVYFPECIYRQIELDGELKLHGIKTIDDSEVAKKMMIVGLWCIQTNPSERPPISRVIEMLEGSVDVLQIPPKPYFSSPPREQLANCTTSSMSC